MKLSYNEQLQIKCTNNAIYMSIEMIYVTHANTTQVKSCTAMHVPYLKIYYVDKTFYYA